MTPGRRRTGTRLLLAAWTLVILRVTVWPVAPDKAFASGLRDVLREKPDLGPWHVVGINPYEALANVALFVPFGVLAALLLPARRRWAAIVAGLLLSTAVELAQWAWFPERDPALHDVLTNTLGAAVGWALVVLVQRRQGLRG